ncbi:Uncharacterised protein [uncultured archaeon]|nr:Uncharacterised protein [uncultured archaeon]
MPISELVVGKYGGVKCFKCLDPRMEEDIEIEDSDSNPENNE